MKNKEGASFNVLHICDYAALYRGNFISSLESLEEYHSNVKNFYLFPARAACNSSTLAWIQAMNNGKEIAFIQKSNLLSNILLFKQIIKRNKINRIVRHFSDFKIDIIIRLFFDSKNVVRFFHCDCIRPSTIRGTIKHRISEMVWKGNKLVGVSDAIANKVKLAHPNFSVHSIVNAVFFDRLDSVDELPEENAITLFMMGWDYNRKGVDLAIKATRALREKYNLILRIAGGKSEDKIKEMAKDILGAEVDWIVFLAPTNHVGTYYKASDIFLSPSRQEAFGYANIEAAYCKNSIVLSKVDGQGELQIDGAYWIESENLEDFIQKLEMAIVELDSPEKKSQKEKVKEQVKRMYSLEEWSNKLVALFIDAK